MLYKALDWFFIISHFVIVLFTVFGWIPKKTRTAHFVLVLITIFSWTILGYFFGWGYCFWTDWHWEVRSKLGKISPPSYVKLLVDTLTGKDWNVKLVDTCTEYVFYFVLIVSFWLNRGLLRRRAIAS